MLRVTTTTTGSPGAPYYTIMHFEGELQAEADASTSAVRTFWAALASGLHSSADVKVNDEVEVVDVATGQTTGTFQSPTLLVEGTNGTDPLPWATQGLIRWQTGTYINGRQLRGRTFIPACVEANSTTGSPVAAWVTSMQNAANTLLASSDLGVYSPTHNAFNLGAVASAWTNWAILRTRRY